MKKRKLKKKIIILFIIIILIGAGFIIYKSYHNKSKNISSVNVLKEIKEYEYYLYDNDTEIYKKEFDNLIKILSKEDVNYENYSESISKLFVIDFYDLNSKKTNTDIGGVEYIYKENLDNFILNAKDTIYKNVESDIYNDRIQDLPIIIKVDTISIKDTTFKIDKKEYDGYITELNISYKKDLEYPSNILVTTIKKNKRLEIVKLESK